MNILSKDILPLKTSQKFSSVLEPYAVKVASTVLRRGCHCEVMFLSDYLLLEILKYKELNFSSSFATGFAIKSFLSISYLVEMQIYK